MSKSKLVVLSVFCVLAFFNAGAQNSHWANPTAGQYTGTVSCIYEDTAANLLYLGSGSYVRVYDGYSYPIMGSSFGWQGVRAIAKYNGVLYCGSVAIGKEFNWWNGSDWDTSGIKANGPVAALYVYNGELYVGGTFTTIAGIQANGLAKYDGVSWSAIGNFPFSYCYGVDAIIFFNGELYIGGSFGDSSSHVMNIARWNGSQWNTVGNGVHGGMDDVTRFEIFNNELYLAGMFTAGDGNAGNYIEKWDGNTLSDVGGGLLGFGNGQVWDLQTYHNALYAAGAFSYAGGVYAQHIAKWDGINWCGTNDTLNNLAFALGIYNDTLFVGGGFSLINSDTIISLAKWIGGNFGDSCGNMTGIHDEYNAISASIYPNPVSNFATIKLTGFSGRKFITISDVYGREIWRTQTEENLVEFSSEGIEPGLFFYRILNGDKVVSSGKFIIQ